VLSAFKKPLKLVVVILAVLCLPAGAIHAAMHEQMAICPKGISLGNALSDRGEVEAALDHYRRAVAVCPDMARLHNNLGAAYRTLGRDEDAWRHFRTALRLAPGDPHVHFNLGLLLAKTEIGRASCRERV